MTSTTLTASFSSAPPLMNTHRATARGIESRAVTTSLRCVR
jgi:hypothetical protein